MDASASPPPKAATGIGGLDDILEGGFPVGRTYLVEGEPGSGKTTLALAFLLEGERQGERGIYVTLSETEAELRDVARSHGWDLANIAICDLQANEESLTAEAQYTLFHPSEVELSEATKLVLETVERIRPSRIVFDSLSEMRLLARDSLRYRRQVLALKHYFAQLGCTVLLLDTQSQASEFQIESIAHGVLQLEQLAPEYGGQRRRLRVAKVRGMSYREGYHDYTIQTGGLVVYPRLVAAEHFAPFSREQLSSGVAALDAMLGGGLERGTSALLLGASGVGKSSVATQYLRQAALAGRKCAAYLFDESISTWIERGDGLGMNLRDLAQRGMIAARQVNPAELSPGELTTLVRASVEQEGAEIVLIDSLNGYQAAMAEERHLGLHLHELLAYLGQRGVLTLMVMAQHGLLGESVSSPQELSYIADTVLLLRYFEAFGEVRQAISVVKKRIGPHERKIRELRLGLPEGIHVGRELDEFSGVLTGRPIYDGGKPQLMTDGRSL